MLHQTTEQQDSLIREAVDSDPTTYIDNLFDIISDLDRRLTVWVETANKLGINSPEDLRKIQP